MCGIYVCFGCFLRKVIKLKLILVVILGKLLSYYFIYVLWFWCFLFIKLFIGFENS